MSVKRNNKSTTNRGKNRGVLWRVPDLKAYLNVSESWIFKRCMAPDARERHGITEELPRLYVGGALRFDPAEVAEWLRSQPRVRRKRNRQTIFTDLEDAQVEEVTGGPR